MTEPTVETLQIKDFRKDEKIFYGRVNTSNNPIIPRSDYIKPFPSNNRYRALNFVVDAFEDMKKKFERHVSQGYLQMDDPILSTLSIENAYISSKSGYDAHITVVQNDFDAFIKSRSRIDEVVDFDSFLPFFMEYLELTNPGNPMTRSMYQITNLSTPMTSGLAFDLFAADAGDDVVKIDDFYKKRNFEYFKNLAFQYGFVLDKHVPWRVIADINSPVMDRYIRNAMGTDSANGYAMLQVYYKEIFSQDIPNLIYLVLSLYNAIATSRPFETRPQPAPTVSSFSGKTKTQGCKVTKVIRFIAFHCIIKVTLKL